MAIRVMIPTVLRRHTGGQTEIEVNATSLKDLLDRLRESHPSLVEQILTEDGSDFRSFITVFVNDEDVRFLEGLNTPLRPGDTVSLIPSIAGGMNGTPFS